MVVLFFTLRFKVVKSMGVKGAVSYFRSYTCYYHIRSIRTTKGPGVNSIPKKERLTKILLQPKITIALLDQEDLRALAHLMDSYPSVLKEKALAVVIKR